MFLIMDSYLAWALATRCIQIISGEATESNSSTTSMSTIIQPFSWLYEIGTHTQRGLNLLQGLLPILQLFQRNITDLASQMQTCWTDTLAGLPLFNRYITRKYMYIISLYYAAPLRRDRSIRINIEKEKAAPQPNKPLPSKAAFKHNTTTPYDGSGI